MCRGLRQRLLEQFPLGMKFWKILKFVKRFLSNTTKARICIRLFMNNTKVMLAKQLLLLSLINSLRTYLFSSPLFSFVFLSSLVWSFFAFPSIYSSHFLLFPLASPHLSSLYPSPHLSFCLPILLAIHTIHSFLPLPPAPPSSSSFSCASSCFPWRSFSILSAFPSSYSCSSSFSPSYCSFPAIPRLPRSPPLPSPFPTAPPLAFIRRIHSLLIESGR